SGCDGRARKNSWYEKIRAAVSAIAGPVDDAQPGVSGGALDDKKYELSRKIPKTSQKTQRQT
ncbi:MAG: hypothetical protein ABL899_02360, partial [Nitrospira sp.]